MYVKLHFGRNNDILVRYGGHWVTHVPHGLFGGRQAQSSCAVQSVPTTVGQVRIAVTDPSFTTRLKNHERRSNISLTNNRCSK